MPEDKVEVRETVFIHYTDKEPLKSEECVVYIPKSLAWNSKGFDVHLPFKGLNALNLQLMLEDYDTLSSGVSKFDIAFLHENASFGNWYTGSSLDMNSLESSTILSQKSEVELRKNTASIFSLDITSTAVLGFTLANAGTIHLPEHFLTDYSRLDTEDLVIDYRYYGTSSYINFHTKLMFAKIDDLNFEFDKFKQADLVCKEVSMRDGRIEKRDFSNRPTTVDIAKELGLQKPDQVDPPLAESKEDDRNIRVISEDFRVVD